MASYPIDNRVVAALEPLGLGSAAQSAYTVLIQNESASRADLCDRLALDPREVQLALDALMAERLIVASQGGDYSALAPQERLSALLAAQRTAIDDARDGLAHLQELFEDSRSAEDVRKFVEVLTDPDSVLRRINEVQTSASHEVMVFDKAPYVAPSSEVTDQAIEQLRRGLKVRVIYESSALADESYATTIRRMREMGEESRVVPSLPGKLMIVDRRSALVPLGLGPQGRRGLVLLSAASIVSMLAELFDVTWHTASPLTSPGSAPGPEHTELQRELLVLVASGLTDAAIARQLGVSRRTVQRRLHEMMRQMGATSRSQLAARAERDGYLQ